MMFDKKVRLVVYMLIAALMLAIGLLLVFQPASGQDNCEKVAHISDIHEYHMAYTDPEGRTICKLILHLHRDNPGDPQEHITFHGTGEKQGYWATFLAAHVEAHVTTNAHFISNADVFALPLPTDTPIPPPTDTPAVTEIPPNPTDTPGITEAPPNPTDTPAITGTPGDEVTPQPTLTPPVTNIPPEPSQSPAPPKVRKTPALLPQTGIGGLDGDDFGLWFGAAVICMLLIVIVRAVRCHADN
jgi:hypothetical protein